MKKIILGLAAAAVLATPLAATAANAAPAPATKATGSVTWAYSPNDSTGTVVFSANDKTGGTLDYANNLGETIHGVVTPGTVVKTANSITFEGTVTDGSASYLGQHFTGVVVDGGSSGAGVDQIGLYVERDRVNDADIANVTGGNLTVH